MGQKLTTSLNLRQAYVMNRAVPFVPSLGLTWKVVQLRKSQFTWKVNLSKSYHAPTLNERYWIPQGNPQILPEIGVHIESGIVYNWQPFEGFTSEVNVHGYRNQVKNWIIWNPDRNFRAENIQKVLVIGLELELNMLYKSTERSFGFCGSYSYAKSSYQGINSPFDRDIIGKQLIYVPLHQGMVGIRTHLRQFSLGIQGQFTGTRFTTSDNTKHLAAFAVFNAQLTQKVQLLRHSACLSLHVNNVFNSLQLSLENKAMPGRNFALNLLFYFTKHKQS